MYSITTVHSASSNSPKLPGAPRATAPFLLVLLARAADHVIEERPRAAPNLISGTLPASSHLIIVTARVTWPSRSDTSAAAASASAGIASRWRSAGEASGRGTVMPLPPGISTSTPNASATTRMSEKRIAASMGYRRTGCRVHSGRPRGP